MCFLSLRPFLVSKILSLRHTYPIFGIHLLVFHPPLSMKASYQFKAADLQLPAGNQKPIGDAHPTTRTYQALVTDVNSVPAFTRYVWAPWVGGFMFRWAPLLRTMALTFVASWILCMGVSTMASMSTSGSAAVNAHGIGFVYGLIILFFYSWRQSDQLPIHLHPAITLGELWHGHIGGIFALVSVTMNLCGSWLAAPCLQALRNSAIPDYRNIALRPVSFWGAAGLEMLLTCMVVFVVLQNASILDHLLVADRRAESDKKTRAFSSRALFAALAIYIGVIIGYPSGLYTLGNITVYFGPAWNLGFSVPDSASWTIYIFMAPLLGSLVAYAIHLLTWNMNGLTQEEFSAYVAVVEKKGV